jgi:site-specific recombinase XerD
MKVREHTRIKGKFHDLRKTFVSYFVMSGGSLEHLREILGHEDYSTVKMYETLSTGNVKLHKDKMGFSPVKSVRI